MQGNEIAKDASVLMNEKNDYCHHLGSWLIGGILMIIVKKVGHQ